MSSITKKMDAKFYPNHKDRWDEELFRTVIMKEIQPHFHLLDFGAGRGLVKQMNFKNQVEFVAGIDVEDTVRENPYLNEGKVVNLKNNIIPYPDNTFDIVFSDNVMEHIKAPTITLKEIYRVLKPQGEFLFKTPNIWHYMPMIAKVTPHWFHEYYNRLRGQDAHDTFPTLYRLNSNKHIQKYALQTNFVIKNIDFIEGRPEYLRLNAFLYLFGLIYERVVNSTKFLRKSRCVIIAKLKKTS